MINSLSNEQLLARTKKLSHDERQLTVEILTLLREIESRKLFLKLGFRSLFEYAVKELSYSEDAAYRRISAMRLTRDVPEVAAKIKSGTLSLTAACKAQKFFKSLKGKSLRSIEPIQCHDLIKYDLNHGLIEKRVNGDLTENGANGDLIENRANYGLVENGASCGLIENGVKNALTENDQNNGLVEKNAHDSIKNNLSHGSQPSDREVKLTLIEKLENKSTREVEKELLKLNPEAVTREKVRQITIDKTEIKIIVDEDLKQKLDQLRNLLSHVNPSMNYRDLIAYLAEMGLKKLDPMTPSKTLDPSQKTHEIKNLAKSAPREIRKIDDASAIKNLNKRPSQRDVSGAPRVTVHKNSRYISTAIKRKIWQRDGGRCTYTEAANDRRCSSTHLLQLDHIKPFAFGGETSMANLRLLCQQHNLLRLSESAKV